MQATDTVALKVGDATLTVSAEAAARAYIERIFSPRSVQVSLVTKFPRIGASLEDGTYAGIARGDKADCPLIVGPQAPKSMNWEAAKEYAATQTGWRLPTRKEQALCFANVPELFEKDWYWSGEQYEAYGGFAWAQSFSSGVQDCFHGYDGFRVRLVRSISVID